MHSNRFRITAAARAVLLALAVVGLAACGTTGTQRADSPGRPGRSDTPTAPRLAPEQAVRLRAIKRWELLIDKRFADAYAYLSPGYREIRPVADYVKVMQGRPLQWTRAYHKLSKCEAESCIVDIEVHAKLEMPLMRVGTVDTLGVLNENWILSEGEWYLVPSADR